MTQPRWFTAIPHVYDGRDVFLERDAGLLTLGFRSCGVDSRLVCLGGPTQFDDRPITLARESDLARPEWWKQWRLDGVLLFAWTMSRYTPIARAIRQSGAKLILKLDSDGIRIPQVWPARYFYAKSQFEKEIGRPFPWVIGGLKTAFDLCFGKFRARGVIEHLEQANAVLIESPIANQRYRRFLTMMGAAHLCDRLFDVPHPIAHYMRPDSEVQREPLLISVGRWDSHLKGGPLLIDVLHRVLAQNPAYRARIIGAGEENLRPLLVAIRPEIRSRIELTGRVAHAELPEHYSQAQISLCTSHTESFHIASAEALACGCSVVGPSPISSMHAFCAASSGTLASDRKPCNFADAVLAEIAAWERGDRVAGQISSYWRPRVEVGSVARRILEIAR